MCKELASLSYKPPFSNGNKRQFSHHISSYIIACVLLVGLFTGHAVIMWFFWLMIFLNVAL